MFGFLKKRKKSIEVKTLLCIPGNWKDRTELVTAVVEVNKGEFLMAGAVLMHVPSQQAFMVEIAEPDDRLEQAFRAAGRTNQLEESFLEEVAGHQQVLYLSGETGNPKGAKAIAEAAQALLNAGGLGVKVESAGIAFSKTQWETQLIDFKDSNLYSLFVMNTITDEKGNHFSCGMHNLGCKDTFLEVEEESLEEAVYLLDVFNYYQLIEQPMLQDGHTFGTAVGAPVYRITTMAQQPYEGEELFKNPLGMWKLKKIT